MDHRIHSKPPLSKGNRSQHTPAPSLIDRARRRSVSASALRDIHRSPRLRWSTEEQGGCQGEKSMVRSNQVTRVPTYLPERGRKGREIPLKQVVPPPQMPLPPMGAGVAIGQQQRRRATPTGSRGSRSRPLCFVPPGGISSGEKKQRPGSSSRGGPLRRSAVAADQGRSAWQQ